MTSPSKRAKEEAAKLVILSGRIDAVALQDAIAKVLTTCREEALEEAVEAIQLELLSRRPLVEIGMCEVLCGKVRALKAKP